MDPRVSKLPLWAQHLVKQMDEDLARAYREIGVHERTLTPSNTTVDPKLAKISLGDNAVVRFTLPEVEVDISVTEDGELSIRSAGMNHDLLIKPRNHHSLRITSTKRKDRRAQN